MVGGASVGGASVPAPSSAAAVKVFAFMVHFVTNAFVNANWRRTSPVPVYCKVASWTEVNVGKRVLIRNNIFSTALMTF